MNKMRKLPILTLTMNPAVDVSGTVPAVKPSHKLRCEDVWHDAGGGGINVARVLKRFDARTLAVFPAGGPIGTLLMELINAEEVPHLALPIDGHTREDFSVTELTTRAQYRFVLPGPNLSRSEVAKCLNAIAQRLSPGTYLVASGSLPPGVAPDFYAELAKLAAEASAIFVLDTSGPALKAAIDQPIFLIKPSQNELGQIAGSALLGRKDCLAAAGEIVARGKVQFVAVSMGAEGALLVGKGCSLFANAPEVNVKTTIGAGDSFLAALVWAFAHGTAPAEALKLAATAGTAALLSTGTGLCTIANIKQLEHRIHVERLDSAS
ncbi:MAG TPA: 1-phosphofructokinase family hexose kinase [Rhizomicrobium sp.]|nr:1-phosphofructokinase family hexose kinase [Rhizomicrobium sp.]